MKNPPPRAPSLHRRQLLTAGAGAALAPSALASLQLDETRRAAQDRPTLVGSANALPGMQKAWEAFAAGRDVLDTVLDEVSRNYIQQALTKTSQNKRQAAKLLGLNSHQVLTARMKRLGLAPDR